MSLPDANKKNAMSRPIPIEEMVRLFKLGNTTSHILKIDNFSLLKKYSVRQFESSVFDLGGHKWKLHVYPNGYKRASLAIFLENQASINVNLEYELFIISQLEPKWHSQGKRDFGTSSTLMKKGILIFESLAALEADNHYLIEDSCMVGVKLHGIEPAKSGTAESFSLIEKPPNHKVTWMMTKFSSFDPEQSHQSNEFVVGNRKWRIEVHPRGCKKARDESFSVYLLGEGFINNSPRKQTIAKFKLRVLDQANRDHVEKTYLGVIGAAPDNHHGFSDFMPLEELDEPYLVKDKLYVGVEFEVISVSSYC